MSATSRPRVLRPRNDLTDQRFGRLIAKSYVSNGKSSGWNCLCDCGRALLIPAAQLRKGASVSCGCYRAEVLASSGRKHGGHGTAEYSVWADMRKRCSNPRHEHFASYGGRGIRVCERWSSFENFLADMGPRPAGFTIEREDVDGNYEPSNCTWATRMQQARNKRSTVRVTVRCEQVPLVEACERLGVPYSRVLDRINKLGWAAEKALTEPKKINGTKYAAEVQP